MILSRGSALLLYTDGLTDAMDAKREFFGAVRVHEALTAIHNSIAQEICSSMVEAAISYYGAVPQ